MRSPFALLTLALLLAAGAATGAPIAASDPADEVDREPRERLEAATRWLVDPAIRARSGTIHDAVALGISAGEAHAIRTGVPLPPLSPPRHATLQEAVEALAAQAEVELPDHAAADLAALDPAFAAALVPVVDAFLLFHAESAVLRDMGGTDPHQLARVLSARAALLRAIPALEPFAGVPPAGAEGSGALLDMCGPSGLLLINPSGPHLWPCLLIIDTHNDSQYANNAGGNDCAHFPAAALIDLGGNDIYGMAPWDGPSAGCGRTGGAYFGAGFLFDLYGNDAYVAGMCGEESDPGSTYCASDHDGASCSNGGACSGAGFLLDAVGSDWYAGGFASNGGSNGGPGVLLDPEGHDVYFAYSSCWSSCDLASSSNGGAYSGEGLLVDGIGNDLYVAGEDSNGGVSHGSGLLLDLGGVDDYRIGYGVSCGPREPWLDCPLSRLSYGNGYGSGTGNALLWDIASHGDAYLDDLADCTDCSIDPKGPRGRQWDDPIVEAYEPLTVGLCGEIDRICIRGGPTIGLRGVTLLGPVDTSVDLGAVPRDLGVYPSGIPTPGEDRDGDGVPGSVHVPQSRVTVDGTGSPTISPASPLVLPVDPNDDDPTTPTPRLPPVPPVTVARCGDVHFCYSADTRVTFAGTTYGQRFEGRVGHDVGSATLVVPSGEAPRLGPDGDGDGLPASIEVPQQRVTVHPDGNTSTAPEEPAGFTIDSDDSDPTYPLPRYAGDEPLHVSPCGMYHVCYAVDARFVHGGAPIGERIEGRVGTDVEPVALPVPVPSGEAPRLGPDADADGAPAYVEIPQRTATLGPDGSVSWSAAEAWRIALDPDDDDPTYPMPRYDGDAPFEISPCGTHHVCYAVDARFVHGGEPIGERVEGRAGVDVEPVTIPIPIPSGGTAQLGPDADGDGLPAYVDIPQRHATIHPDGTVTWSTAAPWRIALDPDDDTPTAEAPEASLRAEPGCARDSVCLSAAASITVVGETHTVGHAGQLDLARHTDDVASLTGARPLTIEEGRLALWLRPELRLATVALTLPTPASPTTVGGAAVSAGCAGPTRAAWDGARAAGFAIGSVAYEPEPAFVRATRCIATSPVAGPFYVPFPTEIVLP